MSSVPTLPCAVLVSRQGEVDILVEDFLLPPHSSLSFYEEEGFLVVEFKNLKKLSYQKLTMTPELKHSIEIQKAFWTYLNKEKKPKERILIKILKFNQ